jgi:hypothetical protein
VTQSSPSEQYKSLLERINQILAGSLVPKAAIYEQFMAEIEADPDRTLSDVPLLVPIIEALETDLILTMSKLLETDTYGNITKLINLAQTHRTKIPWRTGMSATALMKHHSEIVSRTSIIDALMSQRNKYYAHADKRFFLDPGRRHAEYPLTWRDTVEVIRCLQNIVAEHSQHLTGSFAVSADTFFRIAAAQLLQTLRDAKRRKRPAS